MRITVRFQDGVIEEFDTNTLTTEAHSVGRTPSRTCGSSSPTGSGSKQAGTGS